MKRLIFKVLLLASILFITIMNVIYGFMNDFNYTALTTIIISLWDGFLAYVIEFATTLNFNLNGGSAVVDYVILGALGLSLVLALVVTIRGFIVRRPLLGVLAGLSIIDFFSIGVSSIILNNDFTGGRFVNYLIDLFESDSINTLFYAATFALTLLALLTIFLLGMTSKAKAKVAKKVVTLPISPSINQPLPVQPTLQTTSPTATVSQPTTGDNLSELVKVVMQEELNMMRNTQQIYPSPNMGVAVNPYASSIDLNVVRRIVMEELAKFQGQYISRAEAQALIVQEIATIKAQLRIK
ncbi:MAG: hypothetical protein RLZZ264_612 [Bacillota bacterium]|jgi:hypothetical protein